MMTSLKKAISSIIISIKNVFRTAESSNNNSDSNQPEIEESINRLQKANFYNCDLARLLDNYEENNRDFRITLKRGAEIKSLKDLEDIREKYDLSSVD